MIESQNVKYVAAIEPAVILENAAATAVAIDTLGADQIDILVMIGATDDALTALNLSECDTSGGAYTAIAGADFSSGTQPDESAASLPGTGASNTNVLFSVRLIGGRKRFIKVNLTNGATSPGTYVAALAILSRLSETPWTYAGRNVAGQIDIV